MAILLIVGALCSVIIELMPTLILLASQPLDLFDINLLRLNPLAVVLNCNNFFSVSNGLMRRGVANRVSNGLQ